MHTARTELPDGTIVSTIPWEGGYETAVIPASYRNTDGVPDLLTWHQELDDAIEWHTDRVKELAS